MRSESRGFLLAIAGIESVALSERFYFCGKSASNIMSHIIAFLLFLSAAGQAIACSVQPTLEETERDLKLMLETADYVLIARVSHVLRRRWTEDDVRPRFHPRWIELAERSRGGENVGDSQYLVNIVNFAEATAYLEIDEELFWTGLNDHRHSLAKPLLLPIDMLRPFSVAGHGPCESFPQTCPWDIEPGDLVAVALQKNQFGALSALICSKTPKLSQAASEEIRRKNKFTTKYDALLPYLPQYQKLRAN